MGILMEHLVNYICGIHRLCALGSLLILLQKKLRRQYSWVWMWVFRWIIFRNELRTIIEGEGVSSLIK